jgi:hypothetical protein
MKMNIVALVENSKTIPQQKQQMKYGKSVPKPTTNICDILQSTLIAKRNQ